MDRRNKRRLYTCFILWDKKKNPLKSESFVKPPQVQCCFLHLYLEENLFQNTSTSGISVGLGKQKKSFAFRRNKQRRVKNEKTRITKRGRGVEGDFTVYQSTVQKSELTKKKETRSPLTLIFLSHYGKKPQTHRLSESRERTHVATLKTFFFIYIYIYPRMLLVHHVSNTFCLTHVRRIP